MAKVSDERLAGIAAGKYDDIEASLYVAPMSFREQIKVARELQALRLRRDALVALLEKRLGSMNCTCKFLGFIGEEPPCELCKDRAALAQAEAQAKS